MGTEEIEMFSLISLLYRIFILQIFQGSAVNPADRRTLKLSPGLWSLRFLIFQQQPSARPDTTKNRTGHITQFWRRKGQALGISRFDFSRGLSLVCRSSLLYCVLTWPFDPCMRSPGVLSPSDKDTNLEHSI